MARLFRRRKDIRHDHDDFYEALPYQQQLMYEQDAVDVTPYTWADRLAQLTYVVFAIVESLLALRFVFQLLGASGSAFVNFIYNVTQPLVQPFIGTFDTAIAGVQTISWATIVAMAVYALLAWVVLSIIAMFRNREVY